jgi:DNA-3-methyladenine glycosylase II
VIEYTIFVTTSSTETAHDEAIAHLRAADPVLSRIIDAVGPCRLRRDPNHFYALFSSIVSQQISVRAAAAVMRRVEILFPPDEGPTALRVVALGLEPLRAAGLSGQKARYVLDLAGHVADGQLDLDHLSGLGDEEVIAELAQVKGIGRWTAEMFLIFSLGRPDVLPVDDLGFRTALKRHYELGGLPGRDESRARGAAWAPYRTVATWYLWRSLNNAPGER